MSKLIVRIIPIVALAAAVLVPVSVSAAELDCTAGCNATFQGAYFVTVDQQSTGTGVIDSFVRIGGNTAQVDGHNTSGRPLLNDENSSPNFTRDLQISNIPLVTLDPVGSLPLGQYYEFLLDINQEGNEPLLSLSQVQICLSASGGLTSANQCPTAPVYVMDTAGDDDWVKLNYELNKGSGSGDLFMYIPASLLGFNPDTFVYLYSAFGTPTFNGYGNNDGFEEWAVRICDEIEGLTCDTPNEEIPEVPEPASVMLLGAGLIGLSVAVRRRRRSA